MKGDAKAKNRSKRVVANRANAKKSTGPKETTSTRYNAMKHGLLAEGVTELDDSESYQSTMTQLQEEHGPCGFTEKFLIRRIALCIIRLDRAAMMEAEFITDYLNPKVEDRRVIRKGEGSEMMAGWNDEVEISVVDPGMPARVSPETIEILTNRFQRYETANENRLFRLLHQLERMQRMRSGDRISAPAALDITVHNDGQESLASFGNAATGDDGNTEKDAE